jgi:Tfp pilus assembly pilus retraction ATPase PilT
MDLHDAFAVLFSRGNAWGFDGEKGFCVRREVPLDEGSLHPSVRLALEQGPDILAISGPESREAFSIALAAAGTRRLVLLTIESTGRLDTMTRLTRLCRTPEGDDLIEGLADRLRAIILLAPATRDGIHIDSTLLVADRERESLRLGRIEAFRKSFTVPNGAPTPEPVPAAP